jgi:hypothetical protein
VDEAGSGGLTRWGSVNIVAPVPGDGAVAQMGERLVRNEEVRGSIPLGSTISPGSKPAPFIN